MNHRYQHFAWTDEPKARKYLTHTQLRLIGLMTGVVAFVAACVLAWLS